MTEDDQTNSETRTLSCPACGGTMETISFHDIQVDRCTACKGLWFDALEKEHLDAIRGSEGIDIGRPTENQQKAARINCPVCHTQMILMVDHRHPKVHYHSCQVCYGVFFNAGEFREHKEPAVLHFFHELFHRKRS